MIDVIDAVEVGDVGSPQHRDCRDFCHHPRRHSIRSVTAFSPCSLRSLRTADLYRTAHWDAIIGAKQIKRVPLSRDAGIAHQFHAAGQFVICEYR